MRGEETKDSGTLLDFTQGMFRVQESQLMSEAVD